MTQFRDNEPLTIETHSASIWVHGSFRDQCAACDRVHVHAPVRFDHDRQLRAFAFRPVAFDVDEFVVVAAAGPRFVNLRSLDSGNLDLKNSDLRNLDLKSSDWNNLDSKFLCVELEVGAAERQHQQAMIALHVLATDNDCAE